MLIERSQLTTLRQRLVEPRRFLQVLTGPRQTGKTTLVQQALKTFAGPTRYGSADAPGVEESLWVEQLWELARREARDGAETLLVLDEVQKIPRWSEVVKRLWDEDTRSGVPVKVVVLGSAPLLMQRGLTESLAGRFEVIPVTHWSYSEMHRAFGWNLEQYIFFGGYPGAAGLVADEERWRNYIQDSLIETTISRDVLLLTRVDKPALLRRLFDLGCRYSGQILSYQKMVGQLQEAGNTTTLAHYLELLGAAGMVTGLEKYSGNRLRQRASSPKLSVYNNALISATQVDSLNRLREQPHLWGRWVESAVGAHLLNTARLQGFSCHYWREANEEVDYVLERRGQRIALEVKSGRPRETPSGLLRWRKAYPDSPILLVGSGGIPSRSSLRTRHCSIDAALLGLGSA